MLTDNLAIWCCGEVIDWCIVGWTMKRRWDDSDSDLSLWGQEKRISAVKLVSVIVSRDAIGIAIGTWIELDVLDSTTPPALGALIRRFRAVRFGALLLISVFCRRFSFLGLGWVEGDRAEWLHLFTVCGFFELSVEVFIAQIWGAAMPSRVLTI